MEKGPTCSGGGEHVDPSLNGFREEGLLIGSLGKTLGGANPNTKPSEQAIGTGNFINHLGWVFVTNRRIRGRSDIPHDV